MSVPAARPHPPISTAPKLFHGDLWKYVVPLAIGLALWFTPPPEGLSPKAWQMFAIFVATIAGIITALRGSVLFGIVLVVLGLLVGPGGVSLFT